MINKIKKVLTESHERSVRAYKNILYSFFLKGASIASQFLLVSLTLDYLNKTQYGLWLTLASIVGWLSFFDVGIGNGLRNKLSEALAQGDNTMARKYISTSYAIVSMVFGGVMVLFWVINPFLDWSSILNSPPELREELNKLTWYVFTFFCLRFILMLISNILFAFQKPALNNVINPLGNVTSLGVIYLLTLTTDGSLFLVGLSYSAIPVIVFLIFSIYLFSGKFRNLAPNIRSIDFSYSGQLLGLGVQFFIIQVAAIIIFATSNVIITRLFGPEDVTVYNISYKYFSIITMVYAIIVSPYWSAITEAFIKQEFDWIRSTMRKLEWVGLMCIGLCVLMLFVSKPLYKLWVGDSVDIPFQMDLVICISVVISVMTQPYNAFINGTGKLKLQLYSAILSIVFTIPLAYIFAEKLEMGPAGVVWATICTTFPSMILWRIQYKKIVSGKPAGIWDK